VTVVDSSVWVELFRGKTVPEVQWLLEHLHNVEVSLTDLTLCEVLQGARIPQEFNILKGRLLQFPVLRTGGITLAMDAAERYSWLRAKGITVRSTIDCVIATLCIREGHQLLHRDRDFSAFERYFELKTVKP